MSDIAIRASHLSKRFTLHTQKRTALKERIVRGRAPKTRELWALRDASFEVQRGEAFGIIGHNGSGKSTALKVLTGVYRPTSGEVAVNGRVSALLELGAGFHPELTGRENIRLNGSILGMSRRQIELMMDEIIDFSGIEEFIDAPVKVYSSGMFVRLGFAIAVKLDPEILIMDEVIAVGDEQFQRKCYEHLYKLRQDGCTIVLVSHSMGSIEEICDRAVWIDHGQVQAIGPARAVTKKYLDSVNAAEIAAAAQSPAAITGGSVAAKGAITVRSLEFLDNDGNATDVQLSRQPVTMRFHYQTNQPLPRATFGFMIHDENGVPLAGTDSSQEPVTAISAGAGHIDFVIPDLLLHEGIYRISTSVSDRGHTFDHQDQAFHVKVRSTDHNAAGAVVLPGSWRAPTGTEEP